MIRFLILLVLPNIVFAQASLTAEEKGQIQKTVQNYSESFEGRDFTKIQSLVTPHFLKTTGGESIWKTRFKNLEKEMGSSSNIKNLKIVSQNNKVYVHFDLESQPPSGNWFLMKKNKGQWLFDEVINDFEPLE